MRFALLFASALLSGVVMAQDAPSGDSAKRAANDWLELADKGSYSATWDIAAPAFRSAVGKDAWAQALQGTRLPLGAVKARRLTSATFARSLPGAPDGEYYVLQFATQFEHKAAATETVTPMKDKDGNWRVSGYYIK